MGTTFKIHHVENQEEFLASLTPQPMASKPNILNADISPNSFERTEFRKPDAKTGLDLVEMKKTFEEKRTLDSLRKSKSPGIMEILQHKRVPTYEEQIVKEQADKQIKINLDDFGKKVETKKTTQEAAEAKNQPKEPEFTHKTQNIHDCQVLMVNPMIDCSDKEMFFKNGFKTAGKNLYTFIRNGDQAVFVRDVFRPSKLGQLTKDS